MATVSDFENLWTNYSFDYDSEKALEKVLASTAGNELFQKMKLMFDTGNSKTFDSIQIIYDADGKPRTQFSGTTLIVHLSGVTGIPVGDKKFVSYDDATVLIHELSHVLFIFITQYGSGVKCKYDIISNI
jgi:hypothetical protein